MKENLHCYRVAGIAGGLMLAAGQFYGPLCILQTIALLPLMVLVVRHQKVLPTLLAGFYMGLAYALPQMFYLRMPVVITVILLLWLMIHLTLLCVAVGVLLPRHVILGPLAVGAAWYGLDWINYSIVPIWGMAQSVARSWTACPFAIQFISVTSITGVLFVIAALQGFVAEWLVMPKKRTTLLTMAVLLTVIIFAVDISLWHRKPEGSLCIAAVGWIFNDQTNTANPNTVSGFETLFAVPARQAAARGARVFTSGEMGFYIAGHDRDEWMERFGDIARQTRMWLVVGYFNIADDKNQIFFMNPQGSIVEEYTKTYKTPFEPGIKGNGDLKTVDIDDVTIGGMICHDDNYSRPTRQYGRLKADIVLCPAMDWISVNTAHLQAVRARAIECNMSIARGAACGTSAVISNRGVLLEKKDHYTHGPGYVMAELPVSHRRTLFARFGHGPSLIIAAALILATLKKKTPSPGFDCKAGHDG